MSRLPPAIGLLIAACLAGGAAAASPGYDLACAYDSRAAGEVQTFEACARLTGNAGLAIAPGRLADLRFDRFGLAAVSVGGVWRYALRAGGSAPVMTLDNWADPFSDGLARSPRGGKVGFIDRRLQLVIPARYDGALPFAHGRAVVCTGCRLEADGEHSAYVGGRWFYIDRQGRDLGPAPRSPR